ncbi:S-layer homology domain-containing protein [uncultured Phascolarctobacterium sp.]|uniref:S-layer homology domain-containing protein n=1 Tax=uncultured Phascolarctobacterium sp. TaxID=512296 RepID=UPI0025E543F3|nr:S-layer homology domain-containing protein [uncultured Phascolarctobacterium sp.]
MKKSLVLAMAMALGVTASAYAANPFSDVPAGHWAYDSINKLAAAGVIEGYGDTTFGGDKLMTRYEMAQIVAKAMAKGANVDKLAAEFADELDNLGVRVANLEKKADNVKITGEVRYHYADNDKDVEPGYATGLRSRIWIKGAINDDWTYTGMLENIQNLKNNTGDETTKFQRAYVNGKLGGVAVQAGRYHKKLAEGNVYDQRMDAVEASYGKDVKLTVGYGKATPLSVARLDNSDVWYADLSGKVGALALSAGYVDFQDISGSDVDSSVWNVAANYAFDKNFKLGAMYLKGEDHDLDIDDDGFVVTASYKGAKAAKVGSWGLVAKYYDQGATTYADHTMNGKADKMLGFKGYSVAANYTFAKNIVGQVEWYDLEDKVDSDVKSQTLWSQVVFTF